MSASEHILANTPPGSRVFVPEKALLCVEISPRFIRLLIVKCMPPGSVQYFGMKKLCYLCLLAFPFLWMTCTPEEDDFITDGSVRLAFSTDTLRFDTVFTELGSATRYVKIYNRNGRPIRIGRIALESGEQSSFRMNVDGTPGAVVEEVKVFANDSIYLFAEVTVDPDQPLSVSPFVIEERIVFEINDNVQYVNLEAWGQNANYVPSRFSRGEASILTCNNGEVVWDDLKPYVVYGALFIDSCRLVIPPGARIHVHGGVAQNELFGGVYNDGILYTLANGSLEIRGTAEDSVVIQGDRLEEPFLDDPGQWNGIILGRGSKNNLIEFATIKNSRFGLLVDSAAELTIRNTSIHNTSSSGIVGFSSAVKAENCLIFGTGAAPVSVVLGGNYEFTYCTLAAYGVDAPAVSMSNFFCYDGPIPCEVAEARPLRARFLNSILYSSRSDAIDLADGFGGEEPAFFDLRFEHAVVRVDDLLDAYPDFFETLCAPCIQVDNRDPLFNEPFDDDFQLDSLSVAIGQALPLPDIPVDLLNFPRDPEQPDIGAYEDQRE